MSGTMTLLSDHAVVEVHEFDLRGELDKRYFRIFGRDGSDPYSNPSEKGLHTKFESTDERKIDINGLITRFAFAGDFTATAFFEINKITQPDYGSGAGAMMVINTVDEGFQARVQRINSAGRGHAFSAHVGMPREPRPGVPPHQNLNHSHQLKPTVAKAGRLQLKREGTSMIWLASEGLDGEFRELRREEWTDKPVKELFLLGKSGGAAAEVDFLWTKLVIDIDGEIPAGEIESATSDRNNRDVAEINYFNWMLGGSIGLLVLCLLVTAFRKKPRR
ncbi:MAG: hypothetical protein CMJ46_07225 [Planctomyces sp.]|nr:hypothetical protein [Planctomyces sp.]